MMLHLLVAAPIAQVNYGPINIPPPESRFSMMTPIQGLQPLLLDRVGNNVGIAQKLAQEQNLQARILWIDGTANLARVNTEEKIVALVKQIKDTGFNTIIFDVKPIVGYTLYPSKFAPKLQEWRGQSLPADFDPLKIFARECKANQLPLFVSLNAFSEGHRLTKQGLGYENLGWQTVLYEPLPYLDLPAGEFNLCRLPNEVPAHDLLIGVFTNRAAVPKSGLQFGVIVGRDGLVISTFDSSSLSTETPQIPSGGSLMAGFGRAATYLRENLTLGSKTKLNTRHEWVPISQRPEQQIPLMVNPNNPEVQQRLLDMIRELFTNYSIDGLVFDDRLRYGGINADFSYRSQALFEKYIGKSINWPDDVFKFTVTPPLQRGVKVGPYYDAWITWRAMTLRNWVAQVRQVIKQSNADALFGVYAGSAYSEYTRFGANYASSSFDAGFWFLTKEYKQTGYAALLDFFIPGCYYDTPTITDALAEAEPVGNTVEAAAQLANRAARDQAWVYAGIQLSLFQNRAWELNRALQAACAASQGVMVFDLSHDMDKFWSVFMNAFKTPASAPHSKKGLLDRARRDRAERDKKGIVDPPVIIHSGIPGTGM
ncbi:MAG: family 10 glycosylhydrolase [Fimbriimonadales bacterium]